MKFLYQHDGKPCAAKTAFMLALLTCLFKIIFAGVTFGGLTLADADYTGMAAFLSPLSLLYWGRAKTKTEVKS